MASLVVLFLTFTLGMLVGRQWARRTAPDAADASQSEGVQDGRSERLGGRARLRKLGEPERDDPTAQIQDKLTFYQTLTAPLAGSPARRPSPDAPKADAPGGAPRGPVARQGSVADAPYTVQVAAFKSRDQADRLRGTLGRNAYVAEVGSGAPFRVRVGSYVSRAEAEAAAARLRAERPFTAFVTRR